MLIKNVDVQSIKNKLTIIHHNLLQNAWCLCTHIYKLFTKCSKQCSYHNDVTMSHTDRLVSLVEICLKKWLGVTSALNIKLITKLLILIWTLNWTLTVSCLINLSIKARSSASVETISLDTIVGKGGGTALRSVRFCWDLVNCLGLNEFRE